MSRNDDTKSTCPAAICSRLQNCMSFEQGTSPTGCTSGPQSPQVQTPPFPSLLPHCSSPACPSFGGHPCEKCVSHHISFTLAPLIHLSEPSHQGLAHIALPAQSRGELRAPSAGTFKNYNSFKELRRRSGWSNRAGIRASPRNKVVLPSTARLAPERSVSSD